MVLLTLLFSLFNLFDLDYRSQVSSTFEFRTAVPALAIGVLQWRTLSEYATANNLVRHFLLEGVEVATTEALRDLHVFLSTCICSSLCAFSVALVGGRCNGVCVVALACQYDDAILRAGGLL